MKLHLFLAVAACALHRTGACFIFQFGTLIGLNTGSLSETCDTVTTPDPITTCNSRPCELVTMRTTEEYSVDADTILPTVFETPNLPGGIATQFIFAFQADDFANECSSIVGANSFVTSIDPLGGLLGAGSTTITFSFDGKTVVDPVLFFATPSVDSQTIEFDGVTVCALSGAEQVSDNKILLDGSGNQVAPTLSGETLPLEGGAVIMRGELTEVTLTSSGLIPFLSVGWK